MKNKIPPEENKEPVKKGYRVIYDEQEEKHQLVEEPGAAYGYTYADYLQWKLKERLELIRGRIFKLSAPNTKHQLVVGQVHLQLRSFVGSNTCRVFIAPFDVRLPIHPNDPDQKIQSVVQPDLCVVCDESKIDWKGCCGAPDLVVEILSPGNSAHEVRTKFNLYQEAGVPEYWLINPEEENLVQYVLNDKGKYSHGTMYAAGDTITSPALNGCSIEVAAFFNFAPIGNKDADSGEKWKYV
jgi:Uma2 family endonuclease